MRGAGAGVGVGSDQWARSAPCRHALARLAFSGLWCLSLVPGLEGCVYVGAGVTWASRAAELAISLPAASVSRAFYVSKVQRANFENGFYTVGSL